MVRVIWRDAAIALLAGLALGGCASDGASDSAAASPSATATAAPPTTTAPPAPAPTTPAPPTSFSDTQLRGFLAASAEIEPLAAQLASATPEQREQIAAQIRASLARHGLDLATYNAIVQQVQTDAALQARLQALRTTTP